MARFMGTVRLGARMRRVEVFGDPRHPVVQVDGVVVHDRKPFLARDTLVIDVMGQSVTLTWRYPGLTRLECDLTADGATTTLSPVTEAGEILMPLDATTKRRLHLRTLGYASVAGGLLALWWSTDSMRRGDPVDLQMLYGAPSMILGGLVVALVPKADLVGGARVRRATVLAALLFTLVVGYFFSRLFLAAFSPAGR